MRSKIMTEGHKKLHITFEYLEEELRKAIREEEDYKLRNDAKFRAVNQNVATYKDFKDIVDAAHLRPLEKSRNTVGAKPATSWNPLVSQQSKSFNCKNVDNNKNEKNALNIPKTSHEFQKMWKKSCLTDQERFQLIKNCDEDVRITFLTSETMACSLGDIIPVLLEMRDLLEDFELTIGVLSAMANTKRFTLSLAFLTDEEKSKCRKLFTLLRKNVDLFEKSLSETGITKRLEDLQQKYIVN